MNYCLWMSPGFTEELKEYAFFCANKQKIYTLPLMKIEKCLFGEK